MQSVLLFLLFLFFSATAHAEFMGLLPGRTARIHTHATASVEVGANWYTNQLQWATVRMNVKPTQHLILFADYSEFSVNTLPVSASSQADFPGYGIGGGLMFTVPDFLPSIDVAFRGAYHSSITSGSPDTSTSLQNITLHQWQLNADMVFSPIDPIFENGLFWYTSVGYVSTGADVRFSDELFSEFGQVRYREKKGLSLGVGTVLPVRLGSFYAGMEWLSGDLLLGGGIRYSF